MAPFARVAIVGLGLIGGSIALATARRWPDTAMVGIDRPDRLADLRGRGPLSQISADVAAAADAELIILAAPVSQIAAILPELGKHLPAPALVTDTGSTKRAIVQAAASLPPHLRFIGGHPMAGDVRRGFDAARPDLFDDRPWLLTPDRPVSPELSRLMTFVDGLGGRPALIDPARHDRIVAFVSHLPQLAASALMEVVGSAVGAEGLACAGGGLQDTTRLAASAPGIWQEIFQSNEDLVGGALDDLIAALGSLRRDLGSGAEVERLFTAAADWRGRLLNGDRPSASSRDR
ncbi:MAG TPA: prephenate dehydrogenase/arogenate dehydrogenase family protein [Vicinamibacterales bacterium]